jgi:hypothetical protein
MSLFFSLFMILNGVGWLAKELFGMMSNRKSKQS